MNMKLILLLLTFITTCYAQAALKISINDGDWNTPETWSPVGVPFDEDTVIVNHHITVDENVDVGINTLIVNAGKNLEGSALFGLHGNLFNYGVIDLYFLAIGDGSITRNEGEMRGQRLATGNPIFENMAIIYTDTLSTSNTNFSHKGIIDNMAVITSGGFTNDSEIKAIGLTTSDNFTNNGTILVDTLHASGHFVNNADVRTGMLVVVENVSGINGKFCVAGCFVNSGNITGDLDICDESVSICDINIGEIAASVTFCEASPCATVSVTKNEKESLFSIFPNPVSNDLTITYHENSTEGAVSIEIYSLSGQLMYNENWNNTALFQVDVATYPVGTYFVVFKTDHKVERTKFCVAH